MAFQINQMSYDVKQRSGIVSLSEPGQPGTSASNVSIFFPVAIGPGEPDLEAKLRVEAKRILMAAANAL